ncbi:MAG: hypothetical protein K6A28_04335 [Bacteroidales bacterium]|nr:hypothetical protein [Bacteroidales bacterium]
MKQTFWMMILCLALFSGCRPEAGTGAFDLDVGYHVGGDDLSVDTLAYVNEAGNRYMVTEVQWFLSHLEFQDEKGSWVAFGGGDGIHYFDTDLPDTHRLHFEEVPEGHYQSLRFTFGLNEADNTTGRFPNPPECNMFWPEPLGGGYHYMKLNGKWQTPTGELAPFNVHLGIGQNEDHTEFYQNYFNVEIPVSLDVKANEKARLQLTMVIDNWFRNPNTYDFNVYGGAIMQNQEAQEALKANGHDVFTVTYPTTLDELAKTTKKIIKAASPKPHFYTKENMGKLWSDFTNRKHKKP